MIRSESEKRRFQESIIHDEAIIIKENITYIKPVSQVNTEFNSSAVVVSFVTIVIETQIIREFSEIPDGNQGNKAHDHFVDNQSYSSGHLEGNLFLL